jgi:hypothetical protein
LPSLASPYSFIMFTRYCLVLDIVRFHRGVRFHLDSGDFLVVRDRRRCLES